MGHLTKALAQYHRAVSREVHTPHDKPFREEDLRHAISALKFAAEVRDTWDAQDREAWETLRVIERANPPQD